MIVFYFNICKGYYWSLKNIKKDKKGLNTSHFL